MSKTGIVSKVGLCDVSVVNVTVWDVPVKVHCHYRKAIPAVTNCHPDMASPGEPDDLEILGIYLDDVDIGNVIQISFFVEVYDRVLQTFRDVG